MRSTNKCVMATVRIFEILQRQEDGLISINHPFPNPLIALDLITSVQKTLIEQCAKTMEPKKESQIITGEQGKALIT
jgi:hypothetical protein